MATNPYLAAQGLNNQLVADPRLGSYFSQSDVDWMAKNDPRVKPTASGLTTGYPAGYTPPAATNPYLQPTTMPPPGPGGIPQGPPQPIFNDPNAPPSDLIPGTGGSNVPFGGYQATMPPPGPGGIPQGPPPPVWNDPSAPPPGHDPLTGSNQPLANGPGGIPNGPPPPVNSQPFAPVYPWRSNSPPQVAPGMPGAAQPQPSPIFGPTTPPDLIGGTGGSNQPLQPPAAGGLMSAQTSTAQASGGPGATPMSGPAGMSNPYLGAQANAITDQFGRQFTQSIAPSIRRNSMLTGGFGGSRQGVAEGIAAQGMQQQLGTALSNLYGAAYNTDIGANTARYASDNSLKGSMYGADRGLEGTKYSSDASKAASMYGADRSLEGSKYNADTSYKLGDLTSQRSLEGSKYGSDKSYAASDLASSRGLEGSKYGSDKSYAATDISSQRSSDASKYGSDKSYAASDLASSRGLEGNKYSSDKSYSASDLASSRGLEGNKYSSDKSYSASDLASSRGLEGNKYVSDNAYNVGMSNADTAAKTAGSNILMNALQGGTNMYKALYDSGNAELASEWQNNILPQLEQLLKLAGITGSTTTTGTGTTTKTGG